MYCYEEAAFGSMEYLIARPEGLAAGGKHPAILFLHGAGTRGHDLEKLKGNPFFRHSEGKNLPAVVFAPQCRESCWFDVFGDLLAFADSLPQRGDVDPDRLYLVGVSMGGYGAWQLAISRPSLFAALMPLCGGGMYWLADRLASTPVWAFHGALDESVYVTESINMVKAVNRRGGSARLTIYPDAGHNCWDPTFSGDDCWQWLLSNVKKRA